MGSIYAEMSCRYIGTGAHSWPLSPPNRRGLREREYKRGGLYVPYTKQRRFFTRYKSETKRCGDLFGAENFPKFKGNGGGEG